MMWDGRVILETDRLLLRTLRRDDLPPMRALNGDPVVMEHLGGVMSAESADTLAHDIARGFDMHGIAKIAVERKADGAFIGLCGLSREIWYPDDLEIGWRLLPQHWGNGYATEAARAWVEYAFDVKQADRVISIADVPNVRSNAVAGRLGLQFDHEATLTDADSGTTFTANVYVVSAVDWRSRARTTS